MAIIRPARLDDASALARLNGQLGYPATQDEISERLEPILASREDAVLVAVDGGVSIGWIHVAIERGLEASNAAGLRGLVVDEEHRSSGIGHALVGAAERWARERGATSIAVRSREARVRAHRFYEREGYAYVKTSHVFGKSLV